MKNFLILAAGSIVGAVAYHFINKRLNNSLEDLPTASNSAQDVKEND